MAEETKTDQAEAEETNGGNGSNGGHRVVQAAAIAAATGAAALAAKKAFSARDQASASGETSGSQKKSGGEGQSTIAAMASSSWSAASHTILPFAEEAAGAAGEWVGRNAPDVVVETIMPRFITGFEQARSQSDQSA
jgi:hypothetical protein